MQKLRIGGVPEHFNLPWKLAIESGAFQAKGLDVTWRDFPDGTGAMMRAVQAQDVDIALVLTEGAVAHIATHGTTGIMGTWVESPLVWGIHSGPRTLKGENYPHDARIAISRMGSGSHLMPLVHGQQQGYAGDAKLVEIGTLAGAIQAFEEDRIDTFYWERTMTLPQVRAGQMVLDGDFSAPWPAFVAVSSRESSPGIAELWALVLGVMEERVADILQSPQAFLAEVGERFSLPPAEVDTWFARTRWNPSLAVDPAALNRAAEALVAAGVLESMPQIESLLK